MLRITKRSQSHEALKQIDELSLPFELRQKGRFRTTSQKGRDVGVFLTRGEVLREGDIVESECGEQLKISAQAEQVITATAPDWKSFAKACYHLGNRHVPLQIGELWLRFQPDHVLQQMIERFGLSCHLHHASFDPENGAYHSGQHAHSHGHTHHAHSHSHNHEHTH